MSDNGILFRESDLSLQDIAVGGNMTSEVATEALPDPYQVPPQKLRDVYKRYSIALQKLDLRDENIVDFHNTSTIVLRPCHVDALDQIFQRFLLGTPRVNTPIRMQASACYHEFDEIPGLSIFPSLIPPDVQRELLSRLLHRDLSNSNHQTNLHLHYDISYPDGNKSFFSTSPSTILCQPKDANLHKPLSMDQVLRKKLRWMTLGGQYDWTKKLYPLETPPDFPSDVADLIRDIFPSMDPQAAIVNLYSPGDTLSLHRDVSEEVDKGLVSVSLGCDCLFIVGIEDPNHPSGFQHKTIRLRSGDALFMSKKARFAWHGVPKIIPNTCPEYLADWPNNDKYSFPDWANWMTTKRINLNVRQMRENLEPAERS